MRRREFTRGKGRGEVPGVLLEGGSGGCCLQVRRGGGSCVGGGFRDRGTGWGGEVEGVRG